jgi:hypothetical protein
VLLFGWCLLSVLDYKTRQRDDENGLALRSFSLNHFDRQPATIAKLNR